MDAKQEPVASRPRSPAPPAPAASPAGEGTAPQTEPPSLATGGASHGTGKAATGGDVRYRERDRRLLLSLGVYKVAVYPAWSRLFFGGPRKSCGHVARRLAEAGLIEIHERGFPGGVTWLCLTQAGAKRVGLRNRPKLSGSNLEDNLQTLLFSALSDSGKRRYRLEHEQVKKAFGKAAFPANVHVVVTEEFGEPVLLRCYHVRGDARSAERAIQGLVEEATRKPALSGALETGDIGFAVLCPTPQMRDSIDQQIKSSGLGDYRVLIEWTADSQNLAKYLKHCRSQEK